MQENAVQRRSVMPLHYDEWDQRLIVCAPNAGPEGWDEISALTGDLASLNKDADALQAELAAHQDEEQRQQTQELVDAAKRNQPWALANLRLRVLRLQARQGIGAGAACAALGERIANGEWLALTCHCITQTHPHPEGGVSIQSECHALILREAALGYSDWTIRRRAQQ